jgi:hypothetical protein
MIAPAAAKRWMSFQGLLQEDENCCRERKRSSEQMQMSLRGATCLRPAVALAAPT